MSQVPVRPPPKACFRCKKSHDTPAAFLMACCRCGRAWHHICHIPPVTEKDIMARIEADGRGDRNFGLGAWRCRRCHQAELKSSGSQPRAEAIARPPVPGPPVLQIDDTDNDIQIVESTSMPSPVRPVNSLPNEPLSTVPTAKKKSPNAAAKESVKASSYKSLATPLHNLHIQRGGNAEGDLSAPSKTQRRIAARKILVITPVEKPRDGLDQPALPPASAEKITMPRHLAQPSTSREAASSLPPEPPAIPTKSISSNVSIRDLIATMRAQGQLQPPPVIDYVLRRTRNPAAQLTAPATVARVVDSRPRTRDLEEVERKLEDFPECDAMAVDAPDVEAETHPEPEDDPHDIEDLYGDVAPRYLRQPSHRSRTKSVSSQTRLLFQMQAQRTQLVENPERRDQDGERRLRKVQAQPLQGKELRKKQEQMLNFDVNEVDWGA